MHTIQEEALDELIRSVLDGKEGVETSVVEVSKELPLAEAVVSLTRAPPGILSVTISPPLRDGTEAWLVVGRASVRIEDILAVPDWAERRSVAARIIERAWKDSGSASVRRRVVERRGGSGTDRPRAEPEPEDAPPAFVDHIRYERVHLRIEGPVRLEDHVVTVRGLNVSRRESGPSCLEWLMF